MTRSTVVAAVACALVSVTLAAPAAAGPASGASRPTSPAPAVAARASAQPPVHRLIVRMKDGTPATAAVRGAAAALAGTSNASVVRRTAGGASLVDLGRGLAVADAWAAARALEKRADVAWAEPDLWVHPTGAYVDCSGPGGTSPDPCLSQQWDVWDDSAVAPAGGYSVRASAAWGRTTGRADVVVAVLDTGLTAHPELTANVANPAPGDPVVAGWDFVSGDGAGGGAPYYHANDGNGRDSNPADPGDWITSAESNGTAAAGTFLGCPTSNSSWHGTHVTGTIAARQDNGVGVSGIAPGAKVQPIRVLGKCGGSSDDFNSAIYWAAGKADVPGTTGVNPTPASVINLSLEGPGACLTSTQEAIDYARSKGVTVVVAAGNEGTSVANAYPADCRGVVAVTASTRSGGLASYSNVGTTSGAVTIAAPGGDAVAGGDNILSTVNDGATTPANPAYALMAGTSMATPHVSAAIALMQSRVSTPLTPDQVRARLVATATPWPAGSGCTVVRCGAGMVDVAAALPDPPDAPTVSASPWHSAANLSWSPGSDNGSTVTGYHVQSQAMGGSWHDVVANTGTTATSMRVTGLVDGTTYAFRVSAINAVGEGAGGQSGLVTPEPATAPDFPAAPVVAGGVERLHVTWTAPDDGGSPITSYGVRYRLAGTGAWSCGAGSAPACSTGSTAGVADIKPWPAAMPAGTYEVQVVAVNALGSGLWGPSGKAVVSALAQTAVAASNVVYPFVDGFHDTALVRVTSNRPGGSLGVLQVRNSRNVVVRSFPLAVASSWRVAWNGRDSRGRRVANGVYTVRVSLRARTNTLTLLATQPRITVRSSQASAPSITMSTRGLFPVVDGYRDTTTITTGAGVPSTMTWKVMRSGSTYWSRAFSRRTKATAVYAAQRNGGGRLPAGTYRLYVYAKGGEGVVVSRSLTFTVSNKVVRRTAFSVSYSASAVAHRATWSGGQAPRLDYPVAGSVTLPEKSFYSFIAPLPSSLLPYAGVRLTVRSTSSTGSSVKPYAGYATGTTNLTFLPGISLGVGSHVLPVAPTGASAGARLRWYVWNNDTVGTSTWTVDRMTISGFRYVLG